MFKEPNCYILVKTHENDNVFTGHLVQMENEWAPGGRSLIRLDMVIDDARCFDENFKDAIIKAIRDAYVSRPPWLVEEKKSDKKDESDDMSLKIKEHMNIKVDRLDELSDIEEIESIKIILDNDKIKEWIDNYGLVPFKYQNNDEVLSVSITHSIIEFKPKALVISNGSETSIPYDFIENVDVVFYK